MASTKINLTERNLLRYGDIVLCRERTSPAGSLITERYVIWDAVKMSGLEDDPNMTDRRRQNKKKMFELVHVNGECVSMKAV